MTISTSNIQRDISQIGEQGMQIQMVLIRDQQDDVQDDDSLNSSEKKIIKREEKQEQAIVDNRTQGDRTNKIYQSYYGLLEACWIQIKNIHFSLFREDKKGRQLLNLLFCKMVML